MVEAIPAGRSDIQLAPGQVEAPVQERFGAGEPQLAPGQVGITAPRAKLTPVASQRFTLQVTVGQSTPDKLRYVQGLLSHQISSGDVAGVLDRALDALIRKLEKRKFPATDRPRPGRRRSTADSRYVPAHVKRAVWERDGGQCAFVSEAGHRCQARTLLEFDHIDEVARAGQASTERMRLRCRARNQYGAECTFRAEFTSHGREEARRAAAEKRAVDARAAAEARATEAPAAAEHAKERDVVPWLRQLGYRADEARRAAARCEAISDSSLEERVRLALTFRCPNTTGTSRSPRAASS